MTHRVNRRRNGTTMLAISAALGLIVACTPIARNYGYVPPDEDLAQIEVGRDTRDSVAEKVGTPLNYGVQRDGAWYYVASRRETWGPAAPKTVERKIVAIRFNDGGAVENIERLGVEDGQVVVLTARVTDPSVSELGFLRQVFGNVGTPAAGDLIE